MDAHRESLLAVAGYWKAASGAAAPGPPSAAAAGSVASLAWGTGNVTEDRMVVSLHGLEWTRTGTTSRARSTTHRPHFPIKVPSPAGVH